MTTGGRSDGRNRRKGMRGRLAVAPRMRIVDGGRDRLSGDHSVVIPCPAGWQRGEQGTPCVWESSVLAAVSAVSWSRVLRGRAVRRSRSNPVRTVVPGLLGPMVAAVVAQPSQPSLDDGSVAPDVVNLALRRTGSPGPS